MAAGAFAFGLTDQSKVSNGIMNDFAFVGAHGFQCHGVAGFLHRRCGVFSNLLQVACTLLTVTVDVQDQPRTVFGRGEHGKPRQLLKGFKDFSVLAHQAVETIGLFLGDDGDVGPSVADLDVNVAVDVCDVEEFLQVICSDVALFFEAAGGSPLTGYLRCPSEASS